MARLRVLIVLAAATFGQASAKAIGTVSLSAKMSFVVQQTLIRYASLSVLAFFITSVFFGGWLWRRVNGETESVVEATFKAYSLLNDIPGADACEDRGVLPRLVACWLHLVGVLTFAIVLGIVSDGISTKVESLRTSNERVLETKHTVLVNFGEYTKPVLRQLEAARREGRLSGSVVIIADHDKEEMDAEVEDELGKMSPRPRLSVTTRSGTPTELSHMQRVSAGTARRIIVTPPAEGVEGTPQAKAAAEYPRALKESAALALTLQESAQPSDPARRANVVVSTPSSGGGFEHGEGSATGAKGGFASYAEVAPSDFVSRLLAQCMAQPGLSRVYEELLLQGEGNELYAEPVNARLVGQTFGTAWRAYPRATPLGVLSRTGKVHLGPIDGQTLCEGDKMVLLARNQNDCRAETAAAAHPKAPASDSEAASGGGGAAKQDPLKASAAKKLLVLNWNPKMPDLLEQIDEVSPSGSTITLMCEEGSAPASPRLRRCKLELVHADPTAAGALQQQRLADVASVLVLQRGEGGEAQDSHTLACTLALQEALAREGIPAAEGPRLVGEIIDPEMEELLSSRFDGRVVDLVLPSELASGTLVQFTLQPELKGVYSTLLSPEGKEIVLLSAESYVGPGENLAQLSFAEVYQRARGRGEVALGVLRDGQELPRLADVARSSAQTRSAGAVGVLSTNCL